jgi:hypothetical protein
MYGFKCSNQHLSWQQVSREAFLHLPPTTRLEWM